MRVIVTRPADQANDWVARLAARGIDALALPLIGIAPAPDPAAVRAAWAALPSAALAVFVSPNAVQQFFAGRDPADPPGWPSGVLAGSTGGGTSRALREAGVPAAQLVEPPADALQFDSEALWALLRERPWAGRRVLVVRGDGGREWLAQTLRAAGAEVELVAAYRRCGPANTAAVVAMVDAARADPADHLWFFSSSEAIANLQGLAPGADWSAAGAIATHPRIVECAREAGFGRVMPSRPAFDDVIACIQSAPSRKEP